MSVSFPISAVALAPLFAFPRALWRLQASVGPSWFCGTGFSDDSETRFHLVLKSRVVGVALSCIGVVGVAIVASAMGMSLRLFDA